MSDSPKQETADQPKDLENTQAELGASRDTKATEKVAPEPATKSNTKPKEAVKTDKSPEKPKAKPKAESATSDDAKSGRVGLLLALICLLLILGLAGFGHYRFEQLTTKLTTESQTLKTAISAQGGQFDVQLVSISDDLNRAQQDRESQNILFEQLQSKLTDAIKQVEAGQKTSDSDWRLAEVEYLLRLANQRILTEKRPEGALALLHTSDKIIRELDDVTLFNLREAIANEILSLEAVPKLDVEGTYLRLSALIGQAGRLATLSVEQQRELPNMLKEITPDLIDETLRDEVQNSLSSAMSRLESLIIIQHHDDPIEPLLSPEKGTQLRQSVQLLLSQTQLAMLRQQQQIFNRSLEEAETLIARYFDNKSADTQAMLTAINELKPLQVATEMPDISGSLSILQAHIAELTKLGSEARQ